MPRVSVAEESLELLLLLYLLVSGNRDSLKLPQPIRPQNSDAATGTVRE